MLGIHTSRLIESRIAALLGVMVDVASSSLAWPRGVKRCAVAAADALLGIAAVWVAFSLRLGEWYMPGAAFALFAVAMLAAWFPIALWRGVYRTIFRFSGRGAIITVMVAAGFTSLPLIAAFMVIPQDNVPRTMAILGPLIFFMAVSLSRIIGRYVMVDLFSDRLAQDAGFRDPIKRVVIYGAGATGQRLAQAIAVEAGMRLIAYVDDAPDKAGHLLDGVRVHHSSQIAELTSRQEISDILIAITNVSLSRRRAILAALEGVPVNVQTLPPMREVLEGRISAAALRPIAVEDLLGRDVVPVHDDLLSREITGKLVMVTGAGGSIGSEICRQVLAQKPAALVMVEVNEFALFSIGRELTATLDAMEDDEHRPKLYQRLTDVSNNAAVRRLFAEFAPHTIFHAAAYKHVPMVEDNVVEAVRNNVLGTRAMAEAALHHGAQRFVLISTDKAVRPPNVMGASKRVCEIILQDLARLQQDELMRDGPSALPLRAGRASRRGPTVFSMVRFGNVLGSSGSVVPIFQRQIEAGGPVTVTHREVTRYFMTIFEAAQLVIQAGAMARGGEVFLLDMGEPVKIWDLARSMVQLAGLRVRDERDPDGDIAIVESGLRPGEKLYEELLLGENSAETEHPRICQGHETCPPAITVGTVLNRLEQAIAAGDDDACRIALRSLVPTLRFEPSARPARMPIGEALVVGGTAASEPRSEPVPARIDASPATLG